MTAFAAEKAKVVVHLLLSLLLSQLAILSEFGREVRLVAVGRAGGQLSGVVVGGPGVVIVGAGVAFVGARVVFSVVQLAVWLCGFVEFVGFTGTGGILTADLRVTFLIVGINGLDKGAESVEIVRFANS